MNANDLLTLGLGLTAPWQVVAQKLDTGKQPSELRLEVEADRGTLYPCPQCETLCKAHDFKEFSWRHLNFFQHHCLIKARVPRVKCAEHGIHRVKVPWAREGSGFTLLFEQAVMLLAREMPVNAVANYVGVTDKRIWRVVTHYVYQAMGKLDLSRLCGIGLDETATKRGHHYVTIFVDMDRETRPVIFATPGKGKACFKEFAKHLKKHGGNPDNIIEVVCDMSPAFLSAAEKTFKYASVTVDWFHVVQIFTKALDEVRRLEAKQVELPKGVRWATLKGLEASRTEEQDAALRELEERGLATATAFRVKELLRWVRQADTKQAARWRASRFFAFAQELIGDENLLKPVKKALSTFQEHLPRILRRWESLLSNARLEGLNSLFQAARSRARGYRNEVTFITVIYLIGAPIRELLVP
ncbi:ISL3 family transposase [Desulfonatronum thiodismutans]|uniref:ISL3 family transposase n=1 Tax=Desulfonatronum thiodismutans TaxID=159290 RepID=UPI0004ABE65D|nr:ISL3 family transposase [Desulfonatronum thiodismutans]